MTKEIKVIRVTKVFKVYKAYKEYRGQQVLQEQQEQMVKIDPDLALSPLIFPDASILNRSFQFPSLEKADDTRLRAQFASIVEPA